MTPIKMTVKHMTMIMQTTLISQTTHFWYQLYNRTMENTLKELSNKINEIMNFICKIIANLYWSWIIFLITSK